MKTFEMERTPYAMQDCKLKHAVEESTTRKGKMGWRGELREGGREERDGKRREEGGKEEERKEKREKGC